VKNKLTEYINQLSNTGLNEGLEYYELMGFIREAEKMKGKLGDITI